VCKHKTTGLIAVYTLQNINKFKVRFQVNLAKQEQIHTAKSLLRMTLYSTSVSFNHRRGTPSYTSLYSNIHIQSHFTGSVGKQTIQIH